MPPSSKASVFMISGSGIESLRRLRAHREADANLGPAARWNGACRLFGSSRRTIMAGGTLDPDNLPAHPSRKNQQAHDARSLGPSDSSDSGSDLIGRSDKHNASDRSGTG